MVVDGNVGIGTVALSAPAASSELRIAHFRVKHKKFWTPKKRVEKRVNSTRLTWGGATSHVPRRTHAAAAIVPYASSRFGGALISM